MLILYEKLSTSLMKTQTNDFLIHTRFLAMITISLFFCCEKLLMIMRTQKECKYFE